MSIVFGLLAALCWGTADFLAKQWGERHGILNAVLFQHLFSVLILLPFVTTSKQGALTALGELAALALAVGLLSPLAYGLLYASLVFGNLSINSPIASSSAALSIVLALLVLGERPGPTAFAGMAAIVLGIILINVRADGREGIVWKLSPSALMALGAALFLGLLNFLVPVVLKPLGAIGAVLLVRLSGSFLMLTAKSIVRGPFPSSRPGVWLLLFLLAALDVLGFLAYFASATRDYVSIGAALSGTFAAVSAILGWLVLREHTGWLQQASVLLIVLGILGVLLP